MVINNMVKNAIIQSVVLLLLLQSAINAQNEIGTIGNYKVDTTLSVFNWRATKVFGAHEGSVNCRVGTIILKDSILKEAYITINMSSIDVSDLTGKSKTALVSHLKSADFFDVENFPNSELKVKSAKFISNENFRKKYKIIADLSIKGITKEIIFEISIVVKNGFIYAEAELEIDRTEFGIRYASKKFFKKIADAAIADTFKLKVSLVGRKQ